MIQLQFLNYLLTAKDSSVITVNNLDKSFFSEYPDEYEFIFDHISRYGNVPDKESFVARFPHFDLFTVSESTKYLLDQLYEDRNKRVLADTFNQVRKLLLQDKVDEAVKLYSNASQNVATLVRLDSVDILRDTSRFQQYVDKSNDFAKYYISTGFPELDSIIGGWDRHEELATIVARTNQGKSWLLLKCAVAAAQQGLKVGLYSGEMSESKVGYRIDTLLSHISNTSIIHGDVSIQNKYKNYIDKLPTMCKGSIKVLTPAMINGTAGVTALRAFIEKEDLDMLCIDQHSLLEDDRGAKNPVEKASNISRDLKLLQVLKKIPIISVSQQNRNSTEGGVDSSHVAQSDRISQDSTILIFFEKKDDCMELNLVKSRDSANGKKIKYQVNLNIGEFKYIPIDGDGVESDAQEQLHKTFDSVDPSSYQDGLSGADAWGSY